MGRPKGSRNRTRKYTRRKQRTLPPPLPPRGVDRLAYEMALDKVAVAKAITAKCKAQIAEAPPEIAKVAIAELIADLQWMAKLLEFNSPPAP